MGGDSLYLITYLLLIITILISLHFSARELSASTVLPGGYNPVSIIFRLSINAAQQSVLAMPVKDATDDLIYPQATVTSEINNKIVMVSNDSALEITNWYKDRLGSQGLSTASFVQTNTNGNVLNEFIGIDDNREIRIKITRLSSDLKTTIVLSRE